jgi:hypothetical protein
VSRSPLRPLTSAISAGPLPNAVQRSTGQTDRARKVVRCTIPFVDWEGRRGSRPGTSTAADGEIYPRSAPVAPVPGALRMPTCRYRSGSIGGISLIRQPGGRDPTCQRLPATRIVPVRTCRCSAAATSRRSAWLQPQTVGPNREFFRTIGVGSRVWVSGPRSSRLHALVRRRVTGRRSGSRPPDSPQHRRSRVPVPESAPITGTVETRALPVRTFSNGSM